MLVTTHAPGAATSRVGLPSESFCLNGPPTLAAALAQERFEQLLTERDLHCGPLRTSVTDMDLIKVKRKKS